MADLLIVAESAVTPEDLEVNGVQVWKVGDQLKQHEPAKIKEIALIKDIFNSDGRAVFFFSDGSVGSCPITFIKE